MKILTICRKEDEMRIGLISDTHGDILAWKHALRLFEGCELILHAGDHLYHGAFNPILDTYAPRELAGLMNDCEIPVLHARGNCDSEVDQLALRDPILNPFLFARLEEWNILVIHGDTHSDTGLVELGKRYRARLVVRGHTHEHGIWRHDELLVCNPGSPSLPKGDGIPSVALLEDGVIKLLEIPTGKVLQEELLG
jgi:hypothetical protein